MTGLTFFVNGTLGLRDERDFMPLSERSGVGEECCAFFGNGGTGGESLSGIKTCGGVNGRTNLANSELDRVLLTGSGSGSSELGFVASARCNRSRFEFDGSFDSSSTYEAEEGPLDELGRDVLRDLPLNRCRNDVPEVVGA